MHQKSGFDGQNKNDSFIRIRCKEVSINTVNRRRLGRDVSKYLGKQWLKLKVRYEEQHTAFMAYLQGARKDCKEA